jgi:methylated-DNA-[protein]-cysteine S-methyltransferase
MIAPFLSPDPGGPRYYDIIGSPIGRLLLTGSDEALSGLYMMDAPGWTPAGRPPAGMARDPAAFAKTEAQLTAYFAGELTGFGIPLAPAGRPFQLAVWSALTRIPYGTTTSYGAIARQLGKSPAASRAVGAANGQNPIAVIVPCHRVIGADGGLTGYGGGLDRKEWLLRLEGASAIAAMDATLW